MTVTDKNITFAAALRTWRLARGWTQERAAAELGVPRATLVNWEQERTQPHSEGAIRRLMEIMPPERKSAP